MVADISQASTLPVGPTRFAAWMVWLPAPQARSRTRMPGRMPAISMSVSVAGDRPAENSRSHFAQPGAAFSQVLRSSDFAEVSAVLETRFSEVIGFPANVRSVASWLRPRRGLNRVSKDYHIFGSRIVPFVAPKAGPQPCPLWVKSRHRSTSSQCPLYPRKRTSELARITFDRMQL